MGKVCHYEAGNMYIKFDDGYLFILFYVIHIRNAILIIMHL